MTFYTYAKSNYLNYLGPNISSGLTHLSNSSSVKYPSCKAVSLSVDPFLWAVFAILAA